MTCTVRFEVLIALNVKISVFLGMMPCSLVYVYLRFGGTCYLHLSKCLPKTRHKRLWLSTKLGDVISPNLSRFICLHKVGI